MQQQQQIESMTKFILSSSVLLSFTLSVQAWSSVQQTHLQLQPQPHWQKRSPVLTVNAVSDSVTTSTSSPSSSATTQEEQELTLQVISKLRYRELQSHLAHRGLPTDGTTGQLRDRLRNATGLEIPECIVNEDGMGDDCEEVSTNDI